MEAIIQDGRRKYEIGFKQNKKDTKYNLNYYHTNKKEITCPFCKRKTCNLYIKQHFKSKACKEKQEEKTKEDNENKLKYLIDNFTINIVNKYL